MYMYCTCTYMYIYNNYLFLHLYFVVPPIFSLLPLLLPQEIFQFVYLSLFFTRILAVTTTCC